MLSLAVIQLCCLPHIVLAIIFVGSDDRESRSSPSYRASFLQRPRELAPLRRTLARHREAYDLNQTFFHRLLNYQVEGIPVDEAQFPWIAKVSSSPASDYPFLCTASCVTKEVFLSSFECVDGKRVKYLSVLYQGTRLRVKSYVYPDVRNSKQLFNDISFIITQPHPKFGSSYSTVPVDLFRRNPEDYNQFKWFEDLKYEEQPVQHKVVGYASHKYLHRIRSPDVEYKLVELPVVVGIHMCETILSVKGKKQFHVPCYLSCNADEFFGLSNKCRKYIGTEGAAIINANTGGLLGVATWGAYAQLDEYRGHKRELPVGMALIPDFDHIIGCAVAISKIAHPKEEDIRRACPHEEN